MRFFAGAFPAAFFTDFFAAFLGVVFRAPAFRADFPGAAFREVAFFVRDAVVADRDTALFAGFAVFRAAAFAAGLRAVFAAFLAAFLATFLATFAAFPAAGARMFRTRGADAPVPDCSTFPAFDLACAAMTTSWRAGWQVRHRKNVGFAGRKIRFRG
ncbi:MAG: hypothetical protein WEF86_00190 [Gemmatimonadota bacterium]